MGHGSRRALRVGALLVLLLATVLTPFQPGQAAPKAIALPWAPAFPTLPQSPLWSSTPPAGSAVRAAATRPQTTLQFQTARSRQAASPGGHKAPAPARPVARPRLLAAIGRLPLRFEVNVGQADRRAAFVARGQGYQLFLGESGLVLSLGGGPAASGSHAPAGGHAPTTVAPMTAVHLALVGANPHPRLEGLGRLPGVSNYMIGNDRRGWHLGVPAYARVALRGVYPGIDMVFYGNAGRLEYDFLLRPGTDPRAIRLRLDGPGRPRLDRGGALLLPVGGGTLRQALPIATQPGARRPIPVGVRYALRGDRLALAVGTYDRRLPLRIDPTLTYSSFLGGSILGYGEAVATDGSGSAYVAGYTVGFGFPVVNPYQAGPRAQNQTDDAFVSKFSADGSALVYSTYLGGGTREDIAYGIAVDAGGSATVVGETGSTDFPVANAAQRTIGGQTDAFVTRLSPAGNALAYSTYWGGSGVDQAWAVALDGAGNAYVAGTNGSSDFPTFGPNFAAPYSAYGGGFVAEFAPSGVPTYSTCFPGDVETPTGGNTAMPSMGIAVDGAGDAYVTGTTLIGQGTPTLNPYQAALAGYRDAFVVELSATGGSLLYGTYLGGSSNDYGQGIALDCGGNIYITGTTYSTNFPLKNAYQTRGPYQAQNYTNPVAFVAKLNPASGLVYSTYLGGTGGDQGNGIAVDGSGDAWVVGSSASSDFPQANPLPGSTPGPSVFVAELAPSGSSLLFGSNLGTVAHNYGLAIALDGAGSVYLTGAVAGNYPTTAGAFQTAYHSGFEEAFATKLASGAYAPASVPAGSGSIPWHPHYAARMAAGLGLSVDLADGHVDVSAQDLAIPARGPDLAVAHTWDSTQAFANARTSAGQGWGTDLTRGIAGSPGSTLTYTDAAGTRWAFPYSAGAYQTPAGLPWQLTTSGTGAALRYTVANILTGEQLVFDNLGRYLSGTDSYGNADTLTQGTAGPTTDANSGGRSLALTYGGGLVADLKSPLWQSGAGAQGQHVSYGYGGCQLSTMTLGAGTSDAKTTGFAYSGAALVSVTTPATHTWSLAYDTAGRLATVTSPISGTVGQAGYTPAYATQIQYGAGQTVVTRGYGTSNPIVSTYSLDAQGQATKVTDGLSHTRQYSYDSDHDVTSSTDGNGKTTTDHYQFIGPGGAYGQLTEVDHPQIRPLYPTNTPAAPITHYVYDPTSHDLTERYDTFGAVSYYSYNGHHDVGTVAQLVGTTALGGTTTFHWRGQLRTYDGYGELTSGVDGRGVSVPDTTSTNAPPSVTANGSATGYTHSTTYNSYGDRTSSSTPPIALTKGATTSTGPATSQYTYDGDGNLITMQSPNNYNAADPTTNATVYGYDRLGRQNSAKQPPIPLVNPPPGRPVGIPLSTIKFDGDGNVASTENGSGTDTYYSHDPLGRTVSVQQPLSLRVQIEPRAVAQTALTINTYTATNLASMRDPQGNVTTYSYDAAGRETGMVNGAGQQLTYGYDNADNLTSTLVGNPGSPSSTTTRSYDALNEPTGETTSGPNLPGALTTAYSYDLHGNLVRKQAPNNDTTFAAYDLADQLVGQELDPGAPNTPTGAHQESFAYDAAGNRIGSVDFRGGTTAMTVDGDNRQTAQTDSYTGVPTISSAAGFDPDGNLVGQTQAANGQTRSFGATLNPADWPQQATNDGLSSSTTGAGSGDLLSQTIQNEAGKVGYNIDQLGRQNGIGVVSMGTTTPLTTTFAFNSLEQMTAQGMPNGVEQDAGYDGANRLVSLTAKNNTTPSLLNTVYQYGYDPLGLTSSIVATVQGTATSQALTHDAMGRLVSVTGGTSPGSWVYDGRGNLTSATVSGATKAYTYSPSNPEEVASTSVGGGPATSYGYDGNGNTTSIAGPGGLSEALSYDAQSRLVQVTLGSPITSTVAIAYNAFGQRAGYTVTPAGAGGPSLAEAFKYQGDQLAQVGYSGTGIPTPYTDTYVYTQDGTPLELLRQQQGSGTATPYWYVIDGQSNVVALTDSGGNVVDSYSYDQWGKPTSVQEAVPQQLRYAGYWYDGELGWYWLSVRSYDPALERFLQPDPSELEGLFSYVYAGDNPADRTDPTGLIATQPTTGCLLTGNNNVECNVQVGSAQWNNEVANGSTIITSLNGTSLSELVPLLCGNTARVCLISSRNLRHVGAADCGLLSFACDLVGNFVSGVRHILVYVIDGVKILCDATICGDLTTIRNGPWYMKILAAGDIALTFVPVGGEALKGGEIAARLGVDIGGHLSAPVAEKVAARVAEAVGLVCRTMCFPAGTLVATPEGEKPIGEVKTGDRMLTENPKTGEVEAERVEAVHHDPPTWVMAIDLADGSSVEVTPEHPFWVDRGSNFAGPGWLKAGELRIGDQLRTVGAAEATVISLRYHVAKVEVFTLTLGRNHDFFVGTSQVLVHNCGSVADAVIGATRQYAGVSVNDIVKGLQPGQVEQLAQFFGTSVRGAAERAQNFMVPSALTTDSLLAYVVVAQRAIDQGIDKLGVQASRLELLNRALLERGFHP